MNRIKQLRNEKNITQDVLAKLLGLEIAGISKLETERVPLKDEYIIKLSNYFDVSTDYLLGNSDIRKPEEINKSSIPEIRRIERGAINMSQEDREKMVRIIEATFEEAFNEDSNNK